MLLLCAFICTSWYLTAWTARLQGLLRRFVSWFSILLFLFNSFSPCQAWTLIDFPALVRFLLLWRPFFAVRAIPSFWRLLDVKTSLMCYVRTTFTAHNISSVLTEHAILVPFARTWFFLAIWILDIFFRDHFFVFVLALRVIWILAILCYWSFFFTALFFVVFTTFEVFYLYYSTISANF